MKTNKGVSEFLVKHVGEHPTSFHMPGHKGRRIFKELGMEERLAALVDGDITEIEGADNLFQPEDIIRTTMDKYRSLYGSRESFLLINGSSAGLIAAILTAVPEGGKLLMARNSHKSVINGVRLGRIRPAYIYPSLLEEFGISGEVTVGSVAEALKREGDVSAVIITSPSYYGICSDIRAIADVVHSHGAVLIVDQAHGAHLKMMDKAEGRDWAIRDDSLEVDDLSCGVKASAIRDGSSGGDGLKSVTKASAPLSADGSGADIVIESTHKTLASFTQTAIANIYGDRVSLDAFADKLQMIESSSPSYILMASLDMNADIMLEKGEELSGKWKDNLDFFYSEAKKIPGLRLVEDRNLDRTKLVFDFSDMGITGQEADEMLIEKGIFLELTTGNIAMAMSGIGNEREDYEKLLEGLREIAEETKGRAGFGCAGEGGEVPGDGEGGEASFAAGGAQGGEGGTSRTMTRYLYKGREQREIPSSWERIHYSEGEGRVSAVAIIPYPPGVPMIMPGEVLDMESLEFAMGLRTAGSKVIGIDKEGYILVGRKQNEIV